MSNFREFETAPPPSSVALQAESTSAEINDEWLEFINRRDIGDGFHAALVAPSAEAAADAKAARRFRASSRGTECTEVAPTVAAPVDLPTDVECTAHTLHSEKPFLRSARPVWSALRSLSVPAAIACLRSCIFRSASMFSLLSTC